MVERASTSVGVDERFVTGEALDAWRSFLRAHCAIAGALDTELRAAHGLTLSDYDVLVQLAESEPAGVRMSDLSRRSMLTKSGITRLIDGLVRDDVVERVSCPVDARVSYARLTDRGRAHFDAARATHHAGIRREFVDLLGADGIAALTRLLDKLPNGSPDDAPPCAS